MPSLGLGLGLPRNPFGAGIASFTGLLDLYGGAAAAYSLRALSAGWVAGDVVLVRRSSDSSQLGFTANEVANGTLTTWTGAGDGFVATWYDQSGNGCDATQATTTTQPKIVAAGVLVVGGLDFDGVDDALMLTGSGLDIMKDVGYGQAFIVGTSRETAVSSAKILLFATPSGSARFNLGDSSTGNERFRFGGRRLDADSFQVTNSSTIHGNVEHLWTGFLNYTDAESYLYKDGVNVMTDLTFQTAGNTSDTSSDASSGIGISGFDGMVREVIVYNTDQSANRVGVEANINDFYTIY